MKKVQLTGVSKYLAELFRASGKTQTEVAATVGLRPSVISMIMSGKMKMPAGRAAALAEALEGDAHLMMQLVIEEHYPPLSSFILEGKKRGDSITPDEFEIIKAVRLAYQGSGLKFDIPTMLGAQIKANLQRIVKEHRDGTNRTVLRGMPPEPAGG